MGRFSDQPVIVVMEGHSYVAAAGTPPGKWVFRVEKLQDGCVLYTVTAAPPRCPRTRVGQKCAAKLTEFQARVCRRLERDPDKIKVR